MVDLNNEPNWKTMLHMVLSAREPSDEGKHQWGKMTLKWRKQYIEDHPRSWYARHKSEAMRIKAEDYDPKNKKSKKKKAVSPIKAPKINTPKVDKSNIKTPKIVVPKVGEKKLTKEELKRQELVKKKQALKKAQALKDMKKSEVKKEPPKKIDPKKEAPKKIENKDSKNIVAPVDKTPIKEAKANPSVRNTRPKKEPVKEKPRNVVQKTEVLEPKNATVNKKLEPKKEEVKKSIVEPRKDFTKPKDEPEIKDGSLDIKTPKDTDVEKPKDAGIKEPTAKDTETNKGPVAPKNELVVPQKRPKSNVNGIDYGTEPNKEQAYEAINKGSTGIFIDENGDTVYGLPTYDGNITFKRESDFNAIDRIMAEPKKRRPFNTLINSHKTVFDMEEKYGEDFTEKVKDDLLYAVNMYKPKDQPDVESIRAPFLINQILTEKGTFDERKYRDYFKNGKATPELKAEIKHLYKGENPNIEAPIKNVSSDTEDDVASHVAYTKIVDRQGPNKPSANGLKVWYGRAPAWRLAYINSHPNSWYAHNRGEALREEEVKDLREEGIDPDSKRYVGPSGSSVDGDGADNKINDSEPYKAEPKSKPKSKPKREPESKQPKAQEKDPSDLNEQDYEDLEKRSIPVSNKHDSNAIRSMIRKGKVPTTGTGDKAEYWMESLDGSKLYKSSKKDMDYFDYVMTTPKSKNKLKEYVGTNDLKDHLSKEKGPEFFDSIQQDLYDEIEKSGFTFSTDPQTLEFQKAQVGNLVQHLITDNKGKYDDEKVDGYYDGTEDMLERAGWFLSGQNTDLNDYLDYSEDKYDLYDLAKQVSFESRLSKKPVYKRVFDRVIKGTERRLEGRLGDKWESAKVKIESGYSKIKDGDTKDLTESETGYLKSVAKIAIGSVLASLLTVAVGLYLPAASDIVEEIWDHNVNQGVDEMAEKMKKIHSSAGSDESVQDYLKWVMKAFQNLPQDKLNKILEKYKTKGTEE